MKKKILIIMAALAAALLLQPIDTLSVRSFKSKGIRHVCRVESGDKIVFSYIHSVSKTPIEETLEVSSGSIDLVKVSYIDQGGAGMPEFEWGSEKFKFENGKFVLEGFDRSFKDIHITVQRDYEDRLEIAGNTIELIDIAHEGENISVACEKKAAAKYIFEKTTSYFKKIIIKNKLD